MNLDKKVKTSVFVIILILVSFWTLLIWYFIPTINLMTSVNGTSNECKEEVWLEWRLKNLDAEWISDILSSCVHWKIWYEWYSIFTFENLVEKEIQRRQLEK